MRKQYSDALIEQALVKVYSRGEGRTIRDVAGDINVSYVTLKNWVKRKSLDDVSGSAAKGKRPQDWQREEQLKALMETHGLGEEALQAWCREHGIFPHHLDSWRQNFITEQAPAVVPESRVLKTLKSENDELKAELWRKDKALAEAAALLVLQEKVPRAVGHRGQMTLLTARHSIMGLVDEAIAAGASQRRACAAIGISEPT